MSPPAEASELAPAIAATANRQAMTKATVLYAMAARPFWGLLITISAVITDRHRTLSDESRVYDSPVRDAVWLERRACKSVIYWDCRRRCLAVLQTRR